MFPGLRDFLRQLEAAGELAHVGAPVDLRYVGARVAAAPTALWFERVHGYELGLVSGILASRRRVAAALGCEHRDLGRVFLERIRNPIVPVETATGPAKEVVVTGDAVDLTALPIPLVSRSDGGPYITTAVGVAHDPEYGRNVGSYRLMLRTRRETSIDLVSASDLKLFYERALRQGRSLPFAVAFGTHPVTLMAAAYVAPTGQDEFQLAGALAGEPLPLVKCETVDLEVPADSEIVLEGELLPVGWTHDEGRFGDFTGFVGPVKWNPVFRVNAITRRHDAILYALHMPDEVDYAVAPPLEGSGWQALATCGVTATAVYAPQAAGCNFNLYASIRKRPGEGKNAVLALLTLKRVKHAVVTDDDVDIFDPRELERALTYRVQPERDVIVIEGARGSHLDPSLQVETAKRSLGVLTAKWGVDATIPEGSDRSDYESIAYPFADADLTARPAESGVTPEALAERITTFLAEPGHFYDVLSHFADVPYRTVVQAWSLLREAGALSREPETGRYLCRSAVPAPAGGK